MTRNQYGYLCCLREEEGLVYSYCAMDEGGSMTCCVPEKEL